MKNLINHDPATGVCFVSSFKRANQVSTFEILGRRPNSQPTNVGLGCHNLLPLNSKHSCPGSNSPQEPNQSDVGLRMLNPTTPLPHQLNFLSPVGSIGILRLPRLPSQNQQIMKDSCYVTYVTFLTNHAPTQRDCLLYKASQGSTLEILRKHLKRGNHTLNLILTKSCRHKLPSDHVK